MPPKKKQQDELNAKLDKMLKAMDNLQSQNEKLTEQFEDVSSRLDTIESESIPPNRYDVLNHENPGNTQESTSDLDDGESEAVPDHKLRKLVESRLRKLCDFNELSSSDSEDEISIKPSKSERKNLKKSGKLRTAQQKIARSVDWPHLHVFRRDAKGAEYDSLSQMEFVNGYLQSMKHEKDSKTRALMYEHLTNLTADASDYPWHIVRNFHGVILCMLETKRLDWHQTSMIQDLRRQYVWSTPMRPSAQQSAQSSAGKPCGEYQTGKCTKRSSHDGLLHVCSYCLNTLKIHHRHPENACRKKAFSQRNVDNLGDSSQSGSQYNPPPASKNARGGEPFP